MGSRNVYKPEKSADVRPLRGLKVSVFLPARPEDRLL